MAQNKNYNETSRFARDSIFGRKIDDVRNKQSQSPAQGAVTRKSIDLPRDAFLPADGYQPIAPGADLEKLALEDKLTGLSNHKSFVKKLEYELKRGMRYKRPVAICLVSLDHLDDLASQCGQLAKDNALKTIADVLLNTLRDVDIGARYRVDQLAIILPETNANGVMVVAERLRQRIRKALINTEGQSIYLTASIGVAAFPAHGREKDELIAKASQALDIAIQQGGDRVMGAQ